MSKSRYVNECILQFSVWTLSDFNSININSTICLTIPLIHRRRIELEDKTKVVASVLGDRILAALAVLPRSTWNQQLSSTVYSKY